MYKVFVPIVVVLTIVLGVFVQKEPSVNILAVVTNGTIPDQYNPDNADIYIVQIDEDGSCGLNYYTISPAELESNAGIWRYYNEPLNRRFKLWFIVTTKDIRPQRAVEAHPPSIVFRSLVDEAAPCKHFLQG